METGVVPVGNRIAILISSGDKACFDHALIKACEFREMGREVVIMIEGGAVAKIAEYTDGRVYLSQTYARIRDEGLIVGVCEVCARQYGVLEEAKKQKLPLIGSHPNVEACRGRGYEVFALVPKACSCCEAWDLKAEF